MESTTSLHMIEPAVVRLHCQTIIASKSKCLLTPGASGPSPVERSTENIAHELNALLEHLGAPGPYILAGMSVGGIHIHTYV
jgi:pimeloyl-ACP methyl ester carboxylesterase